MLDDIVKMTNVVYISLFVCLWKVIIFLQLFGDYFFLRSCRIPFVSFEFIGRPAAWDFMIKDRYVHKFE